MFVPGTELFVHFVGSGKTRVLHPVKVDRVEEGIPYVWLAEEDPPLASLTEDCCEIVIFFHGTKELMQQPATINAIVQGEEKVTFGIQTTGEAVSAESRKSYRVCTVLGSYEADLGDEGARHIVDVSATGLAIIATGTYAFGQVLPIAFDLKGKRYKGSVCVQSIKPVSQGTRYGMVYADAEKNKTDNLDEGLQRLTMDAQRTHLRRLSGAA